MAAPLIPNLSMKINIGSKMIFVTSPITTAKHKLWHEGRVQCKLGSKI